MVCSLEEIITGMPCYLYWIDSNQAYLGCNDLMSESFGLLKKDIIGKKNSDLITDKTILETINQNNSNTIKSKTLCIFEEPFITKKGNRIMLLSRKQPLFDNQKNVIGLINVSVEITDENAKLREERDHIGIPFENILANLPGNIFWLDRNNIFLGCNDTQAEMAGLKSRHDIVGKTNFDMPWKDQADMLNKINDNVMKTGQEFTVEEKMQFANGREAVYLSKKIPYYDKSGEIIGTMGIALDITERKRIEHDLKIAKEIAEISNKAKTEFLENMKHDIRTPLSGIIGLSELIQYEEDSGKIRSYITQLVQSSRELLEFLNNILDSINIASGEIPLVKKRFDLQEVLENVVHLHQPKAIEKNLKLELVFDDHIPKHLVGDPIRVYRIILEMLGNSLKFTQTGYVKVTAKAMKKLKQSIVVQIEVEDTGPGVEVEKQQELFIRFKRLIPSYQGIYKGTGLGLSIVKQFIDDLQGEVYYCDREEGGAKFISLIPLKRSLLDGDIQNVSAHMSAEHDFLFSMNNGF